MLFIIIGLLVVTLIVLIIFFVSLIIKQKTRLSELDKQKSMGDQNIENQESENKQAISQVTVMPSGTGPLIMGLLGLFGGFIPIVKYITGLLSLLAIFIGASQRKKLKEAGLPTGKATAGIVLGTIAVLITVITIAFSAMVLGSLFSAF